jgi:hypothetical protein
VIVALIGLIVWLAPNFEYVKITLPIGKVVPYNLQKGAIYPEFSLRYGSLHGFNPSIFEVWAGSVNSPKEFSVIMGATYTAFSIEIKILEVHADYIVLLVRNLNSPIE